MIDLSKYTEWDDEENAAFIQSAQRVIDMFGHVSDDFQGIIANVMKSAWLSSAAYQMTQQRKMLKQTAKEILERNAEIVAKASNQG